MKSDQLNILTFSLRYNLMGIKYNFTFYIKLILNKSMHSIPK